jgi:hypothetical protein
VHSRIVWIPKHCNLSDTRNQLFEELQPLARYFRGEQTDASDIAAGFGEAGDKSNGNRVAAAAAPRASPAIRRKR